MPWRELQFEYPWSFAILALAPLVFWLALRSYAYLGRGRRITSAAVRVLALAALACALAVPSLPRTEKRVCAAVAVDTSVSVPGEARQRALSFVREAEAARGDDDVLAVLTFGRAPSYLPPDGWEEVASVEAPAERTDLLGAAAYARSVLPEECTHRLVLITDGHDTEGDPERLVSGLAALEARVDVVAAAGEHPVEIIVENLHVPARVRTHRPFRVRGSVYASAEVRDVRVKLRHTAPSGEQETVEERTETLLPGGTTLTFVTQLRQEGEHLFGVEVEVPGTGDAFPENNFFEAATEATGPPMVLYAEGRPARGGHLTRALEAGGFEVDLRGAAGLPASSEELSQYAAVFVSDVPASHLGGPVVGALKRYVTAGGLLVVAGGKHGYQMGGYRGNPIEPLLPVSLDVPTDVEKTSAAVVLVIDTSGSMAGKPISMAREAAKASVSVLAPDDLVEVISFDSKPRRLFMMQKAKNQMMIHSFIGKLRSGGGTDIVKALDLAYKDISPVQAKKKHIVLLTDGQSSTAGVDTILQDASSEGITISTIGLGSSVNRSFLEKIANATAGKASFTANPKNLPRLFMREMRIVTPSSVVEGVMKVEVAKKTPFLSKVGKGFPYLRGYNLVTARGGEASPVLVSDRGDPVLAMWRRGQGWVVAFTSDVKARWAAPWVKWQGFARFWNALIRSLVKTEKKSEHVHNIEFGREGRVVTATVDVVDRETGTFVDGMQGSMRIKPFGGEETRSVDMTQVAPGRYRATFVAESYGTFLARATLSYAGAMPEVAAGSLNLPYPPEYRRIGVDRPLLERVAASGGGRVDPEPAGLWETEERLERREALWPWALLAFLALLPLDLAVRRLSFRS
jgi:uncharacterized membrane protein